MDISEMAKKLCSAERDRMASAEICIDEALTIMDRHGITERDEHYRSLVDLSQTFHQVMTNADGYEKRLDRMKRVRSALTAALPLSDADLAAGHD